MASRIYIACVVLTVALCALFTLRPTKPQSSELKHTSLIAACANNDDAMIKKLVRKGYDINEIGLEELVNQNLEFQKPNPTTPLITAVSQASFAEYLFRQTRTKMETEDFLRAYDRIEMLCELGADPNKQVNGRTAIHLAASLKAYAILDLLIQFGGNPAAKDKDGRTSLHWLAREGYQPYIREEQPGLTNWTRHVKTIFVLLRSGCPVDARDNLGRTPIFYASQSGHVLAVQIFLSFGANPNTEDIGGTTPFDVAQSEETLDALGGKLTQMSLPDRLAK